MLIFQMAEPENENYNSLGSDEAIGNDYSLKPNNFKIFKNGVVNFIRNPLGGIMSRKKKNSVGSQGLKDGNVSLLFCLFYSDNYAIRL